LSLTAIVCWSNLRGIGSSSVARVTAFMPFVGYLIVFNPSFVGFFELSLPEHITGVPSWLDWLHSRRLVFLYFGLLLVSLGILLYLGFAPKPIRRFSSVSDYVSEMEQVASPALLRSQINSTIDLFLQANPGEMSHPMFSWKSASFPAVPSNHLHDLIRRLFIEVSDFHFGEKEDVVLDTIMDEESAYDVFTYSGQLRTDKVMEIMRPI
jgi:hypothetical protein